jgi:NADH-quinone oxidoreductase subunit F
MDLHIIGAEPTDEERGAVDTLLGPPESSWAGGVRSAGTDSRVSYGGVDEARDRRDLLLPALHAVQDRVGWISRGALNYICKRLMVPPAEAWGVVSFYHLFNTELTPRTVVHVCDDIACRLHDVDTVCAQLDAASIAWQRSPCLGQCDRAPAALVLRAGERHGAEAVTSTSPDELVVRVKASMARMQTGSADTGEGTRLEPAFIGAALQLLRRIGHVDPNSLDSYREHGGYRALARAFELGPAGVVSEVITSNLLGRGGAAFPTGRKWEAVARERATPHFLVCNADESEPGTFKDRVLLEEDPFALVEAMTIAAYATGCAQGFIYIRGEYPHARQRVQHAIDQARAAGLLGPGLMGHEFGFDLEIRRGAGAYICGEETALFNSLEGKRGEPRSKPPFPAQVGLFGKPTVVNNVETLVNVIDIVLQGGANWAAVGTKASTGTRLFCLSGHVTRPGLYEAPFGVTLSGLLTMAGGVANGRMLQAILLGGAAGTFVGPDALSMPLTFEDVRAGGATLGSGVVMVFDETVDLRDTLTRIAEFMRDESCGQCVPCRVGTVRQVELLERLRSNDVHATDLTLLTELGQAMRDASICGLGQTASSAIETAVARLHVFRNGGAA